ncbi:hypothetical protein HY639_03070 [Candidatus Woesearchaeota archaeon]|nr:hypothetical protein [Candidatus Woesearchaeota archaeon]
MESLGFVGDIHQHPRNLENAVSLLKEKGIRKGIANGDLGNTAEDIAMTLATLGKSGLEWIVQPGSHETVGDFYYAFLDAQEKYSNLTSALERRRVETDQYHLVFLPGSDFCSGGQYQLVADDIQEGEYRMTDKGLMKVSGYLLLEALGTKEIRYFTTTQSLRKLVTQPEKTVLVCHVPPLFSFPHAVDQAHYGEVTETVMLANDSLFPKGSILPLPYARKLQEVNAPIMIHRENRGNRKLQQIMQELGVTKGVFNHFHESSHRAHDAQGNKVAQGEFTSNLYWMSGWLDYGHCGILHLDQHLISYENLSVRGKNEQATGTR